MLRFVRRSAPWIQLRFDNTSDTFCGLPGIFADSLPEKYGNTLMKKWLEKHNIDFKSLNPIERLCYVGTRGMGALEYEPTIDYFNKKDEKDLNNYENTSKYIKALRIIRQRFNNDSVVVIAGACCSHFEALIANGANFASSPKRIHIHTYDPAVIAIECATTSCNQTVDFNNLIKYIENGKNAYGGIETKGKMKLLLWGKNEI